MIPTSVDTRVDSGPGSDLPVSSGPPLRSWLPGRWFRRVALCSLIVYGMVVGVAYLAQDHLAFPVWGVGIPSASPPVGLGVEEVYLTASDGNTIRAWWVTPAGWRAEQGAILLSYGSQQTLSSSLKNMLRWRDKLGVGVLSYDCPGHGPSTGKPGEESCYAAAEAAHAHLVKDKGVAEKEVILVGESRGGAMATEMAARRQARLLVLMGCFTSFPDIAADQYCVLPARYLVRLRFDNVGKLPDLVTPVFIAHGDRDNVVPERHGERNYAAAREPKRFYLLKEHPHMHPERADFYAAVKEFLAETRLPRQGFVNRNPQALGNSD